jgi:hypothetical protein
MSIPWDSKAKVERTSDVDTPRGRLKRRRRGAADRGADSDERGDTEYLSAL